jgi:Flp pilus assembly protein CpaB
MEVTADDAQKVLLAEKIGKLSLVLRQPGEANNVSSSRRITEQDLAGALGPAPAPAQAGDTTGAARRSDNTTVTIIRGTKPEDYSVRGAPNW